MGWESSDVVSFDLWPLNSRSNNGSLALVSCLSGGYKFASVLRCVGLVEYPLVKKHTKNYPFGRLLCISTDLKDIT